MITTAEEALALIKKGRIKDLTEEEYQSLLQYHEEGYEIEQQIFKRQVEASNKKCGL